ncbi:MAG: NfeD family protein [Gammaproteobacteria bacterium]|nr:NfeD family protein [Gammaproteobacteria bacterium]
MQNFLEEIVFWHWWAFAAILLIAEIALPITFFLWMSVAAAITGVLVFAVDMGWQTQLMIFSVLSVISIVASRIYIRKNPIQSEDNQLNRRGEKHIGRTYTLETDIKNGSGKVRVGDTLWRVEGPELAAGTQVKVTDVNGNSFVVERV